MRKELRYTRYQWILLLGVYMPTYLYSVPNHLFPIFGFLQPEWKCGANDTASRNCTAYDTCGQNLTMVYHYYSAAVDFNLQCGRSYLVPLITSLQTLGLLLGSFLFGFFTDMFGRKASTIAANIGGLGSGILATFAPTWQWLVAFRFLFGFSMGGIILGQQVLIMEMLLPEHRIFVRTVINFWGGGRVFYAAIVYFWRDWRISFRISCLAPLPSLLIILFVMQESPRWLNQHKKTKKTEKVLKKIAKINGKMLTEEYLAKVKSLEADHDRKYTYKDLFATPTLRKRTAFVAFLYAALACTSYGMDLKTATLTDSVYLNTALIGISIALGKPLMYLLDTYLPGFDRRMLHRVSMSITIICLVIIVILINFKAVAVDILITIVTLVGMVVLEWVWDAMYLSAIELFPTVIRSQCLAFCSIFGRIGSSAAAYVLYLSKFWEPAPLVVFIALGILMLTASCVFMPETKGKELTDTLNLETVALQNEDENDKSIAEAEALNPKAHAKHAVNNCK